MSASQETRIPRLEQYFLRREPLEKVEAAQNAAVGPQSTA